MYTASELIHFVKESRLFCIRGYRTFNLGSESLSAVQQTALTVKLFLILILILSLHQVLHIGGSFCNFLHKGALERQSQLDLKETQFKPGI